MTTTFNTMNSSETMNAIITTFANESTDKIMSGTKAFNAWISKFAVNQVENDNMEMLANREIKDAMKKLDSYTDIANDIITDVESFKAYWTLYGSKVSALNGTIEKYESIIDSIQKNEWIKQLTKEVKDCIIISNSFEETRENIDHYFSSMYGVEFTKEQLEELLPAEPKYNRTAKARNRNKGFKGLKKPETVFNSVFAYNLLDMAIRSDCITVKWVSITKKKQGKK